MTGLVIDTSTGTVIEAETDHVVTAADISSGQKIAILEQLRELDIGMARVVEEMASGQPLSQYAQDRIALRLNLRSQLEKL